MKYTDLYENRKDEFDDELTREVMDLLVLYQASGINKTNINNIIDELRKNNFSVDLDTIIDIIEKLGYNVSNNIIIFSEESTDIDLEDGEEYDEVDNMAKQATEKRLK